MPDHDNDAMKPSRLGQAVSLTSVLQYLVMAGVWFLTYQQKQQATLTAWALEETQAIRTEARDERRELAAEARQDRKDQWKSVGELRATMDSALREIKGVKTDVAGVKGEVNKVEKAISRPCD